jgi:hypothetical protein
VDAVGGTSIAANERALRRMEQVSIKLINRVQLYCELNRNWARKATTLSFMDVFKSFNPVKAMEARAA